MTEQAPARQAQTARLYLLRASDRRGVLGYGPWRLPCSIGSSGTGVSKREGDGQTPAALLPLVEVYYRPDRVPRPRTGLPVIPLRPDDGWCDAASDRNYNRRVRLPYSASAEALWRADGLYDTVVVLGFNLCPRRRGGGSAIFMHVARDDWGPTAGCIALRRNDLLRLLSAPKPLRWIDASAARDAGR